MEKFAGALMWVLSEALGLEDEYLIAPMNEKEGRFLLNEILVGGNFGHYDPRMTTLETQPGKLSYQLKRAHRRFVRNLRFFPRYPEEVFWEPIARLTHFWWRKFEWWRV